MYVSLIGSVFNWILTGKMSSVHLQFCTISNLILKKYFPLFLRLQVDRDAYKKMVKENL